ncbi:cadherin-2-like [Tachysurus ichikawai]
MHFPPPGPSAVRFHDCGRGGRVHFECSRPTDFRIQITGDVLSLQPSLSSPSSFSSTPLLVIARDVSTQEQWKTEIRLRPSGGHESQVVQRRQILAAMRFPIRTAVL